jgi:hypothetical protein
MPPEALIRAAAAVRWAARKSASRGAIQAGTRWTAILTSPSSRLVGSGATSTRTGPTEPLGIPNPRPSSTW